jgi:hypothetical protein
MKKIIICIIVIVASTPSIGTTVEPYLPSQTSVSNLTEKIHELYTKQGDLMNKGSDVEMLNDCINNAWQAHRAIDSECSRYETEAIGGDPLDRQTITKRHEYRQCKLYYDESTQLIANMMLYAAKYSAARGNIKAARKLYRDIITTFTGNAYRSYVKKAEFGLEDLKSIEGEEKSRPLTASDGEKCKDKCKSMYNSGELKVSVETCIQTFCK